MTASELDARFHAVRAGAARREADIYRLYAEMREAAPLWRSPWGDVYLSSFDLVDRVLTSRATSHALRPGTPDGWRKADGSPVAVWLMFMDGADHMLMRRAIQGPFTGSDGSLVRRVEATVAEHMSTVGIDCPIDAVAAFARAIPEKVIGGIMGIPAADLPLLRAWSQDIRTSLDVGMGAIADGNAGAADELTDYFQDILRRRPATLGDFNVAELTDALGFRAAAANLAFIAFAGYETTVHLLGSMLLHLSTTPAAWRGVCEMPDLASALVSEVLRLESPVQKLCRWALEDIELSGGHRLRAGEYAVLLVGAANRDPARFPDPERINLSRPQNVHVAFGKGLHSCVGRGLAMIEGVAVLRWLIGHAATIRLEADDLEWIPNSSFRGLERLPITLLR